MDDRNAIPILGSRRHETQSDATHSFQRRPHHLGPTSPVPAWPPPVRPRRCCCHVQCRRSSTTPGGAALAEELDHCGLCLTARKEEEEGVPWRAARPHPGRSRAAAAFLFCFLMVAASPPPVCLGENCKFVVLVTAGFFRHHSPPTTALFSPWPGQKYFWSNPLTVRAL
nr:unnamed protein product [Digitaria exilis]